MRNILLVCALSITLLSVMIGQEVKLKGHPENHISCILPLAPRGEKISKPYYFKKPAESRNLNYVVNYLGPGDSAFGYDCAAWPAEAQTALEYALDIWSDILNNTRILNVNACWSEGLPSGTLGSAGPNLQLEQSLPGLSPVVLPNGIYENVNDVEIGGPDITSVFNGNRSDWYYGTDAMPGSDVDFVSVALHEIGHGLGFTGRARIDDGINDGANNLDECNGIADNACIGFKATQGENLIYVPTIYDRFVDIDNETSILDMTNPSNDITTVIQGGSITGGSGGLFFDEANSNNFRFAPSHLLYTPPSFQPGSSYSHFDEATLPLELMSPSIAAGQAIHDPGISEIVMLEIGWTSVVLPVQLAGFTVNEEKDGNQLRWSTYSELNNDYFEVQHSLNGVLFKSAGKVKGKGSTDEIVEYEFLHRNIENGLHYYRLKQIDLDGTASFSKVKTVFRNHQGIAEFEVSPNPVHESINIQLSESAVIKGGHILNTGGKIVRTIKPLENSAILIPVEDLTAGSYYIRLNINNTFVTKKFIKI